MCGRYYIPDGNEAPEISLILEAIHKDYIGCAALDKMKLGEIFPKDTVPVITANSPQLMQWGFSSFDGKGVIINARLETADAKPMFKKAFNSWRCLIPAGCYFEWKKEGTQKQKYAIHSNELLFMAGLFQVKKDTDLSRFVILTRPASMEISFIHDRMPVILPKTECNTWLNGEISAERLSEINIGQLGYESVS